MDKVELAYDVGCVLCAATETTSNTLQSFIVAAVLHPDIMAKARAELDQVVGHNRLPDFEDRATLPYIQAMVYEIFRWLPTTVSPPHPASTALT
jgi:cytochrome P450